MVKVKVGTDCSGIEAPIEALKKIKSKYSVDFEHSFSSETNKYAIDCIKENNNPKILFGDIQKRNIKMYPI